jgi:hypothetical protein
MKAGAGGGVKDGFHAARREHVDEEAALGCGAPIPVDQLIPFFDEGKDVFFLVAICSRRKIIDKDLRRVCSHDPPRKNDATARINPRSQ